MDSSSSTEGEGLSAIASATNEQRDAGRSVAAGGRRIKVRTHHRIAAAQTEVHTRLGELKRAALENVTVKERAALIELVRHLVLVWGGDSLGCLRGM
jgi:hypothetical protein